MKEVALRFFAQFASVDLLSKTCLHQAYNRFYEYDDFILGTDIPTKYDWQLCQAIVDRGCPSVYLMIKTTPSNEDKSKAKKMGIKDILVDPLLKVQSNVRRENDLFSVLMPAESDEPELIYLGLDAFFNVKQLWVGTEDMNNQLTTLESQLLNMFIKHEGTVLSKDDIAQEIWDGQIEISSVRRLVKRLREKLGSASSLIIGRKEGGYIYIKDS